MNVLQRVGMATRTILLIHKDPNMREVVQGCLSDLAGWNVLVANSILEGLQQIKLDRPDAIIFEFSLNEIDEFLFLKQLRKQPETQGIPIVLLSIRSKWFNLQFLEEYETVAVTVNPFNIALLPTQISNVLGWDLDSDIDQLD